MDQAGSHIVVIHSSPGRSNAEVVYFLHDSVYLLVIRQRCHQLVAVVFGKRLAFIFRSTASSLDHLAETYKGHFLLAVLSLREHNPFQLYYFTQLLLLLLCLPPRVEQISIARQKCPSAQGTTT